MKNIFKTFVAGAFIVLISAAIITLGVAAVRGFIAIASATGWTVVIYFVLSIIFTAATLYGAFSIGSAILRLKRYGGK